MKKIKRFFTKKRGKTGASLLIVIVTVSMLIVMGTTFGFIAMSAYNNSNRRVCQQQAYLTAESCLNILQKQFAEDSTKVIKVADELNKVYNGLYAQDNSITRLDERVTYQVAKLDGGLPSNSIEAGLMGLVGECYVMATYADEDASIIRLRATATYKGYSESLSARIACTTNGALELRKIFSNAQCWDTPIVTLIADQTSGDMYFSSPGMYERWPNGEVKEIQANYDLMNNVYKNIPAGDGSTIHTKPFDIDNKPVKCRGLRCITKEQRYALPNVDHSEPWGSANQVKYTKILDDTLEYIRGVGSQGAPNFGQLYRQAYYSPTRLWTDSSNGVNNNNYEVKLPNTGVIADQWGNAIWWEEYVDKTWPTADTYRVQYRDHPYYGDITKTWYNDWTEIYMFTGDAGAGNPPIVNGDMYVNTRALIGLNDKTETQLHYWPIIDTETDRGKAERKYLSYFGGNYFDNNGSFNNKYINCNNLGKSFEHGLDGKDLFFDYTTKEKTDENSNNLADYEASVLCLNGNMFLFEDARIEAFDSTHTPNANAGIKNNIFAHKKLVIDGVVVDVLKGDAPHTEDTMPNKRNVHIFGDVMCEDDLTIADAVIYGDVYCNGNELVMSNVDVYGNVYFNGYRARIDNTNIWNDGKTRLSNGTTTLKDVAGDTVDKYSFETDEGRCVQLHGGDCFILGLPRDNSLDEGKSDAEKAQEMAYHRAQIDKHTYRPNTTKDPNMNKESYEQSRDRFLREAKTETFFPSVLVSVNIDGSLVSHVDTKVAARYGAYDTRTENNSKTKYRRRMAASRKNYTVNELLKYDSNGNLDALASIDDHNLQYSEVEIGSIFCNGYLFLDARDPYMWDDTIVGASNWVSRYNHFISLMHNRIRVNHVIVAERLQIQQKNGYNFSEYGGKEGRINDIALNNPAYGCRGLFFNNVFVGKGGFFIDGSEYFWYDDSQYNKIRTGTFYIASGGHRGIRIKTMYSLSETSKGAIWDAEGSGSGIGINYFCLDSGKNIKRSSSDVNIAASKSEATLISQLLDDSKQSMANQLNKTKDEIDIAGNNIRDIVMSISMYYNTLWAQHINDYYSLKADAMGYIKGYKPITDVRTWATNTNGEGMYPKYEKDAKLGVWREIKILKWSAPDRRPEDYCYKASTPEVTLEQLSKIRHHGKPVVRHKNGQYIVKRNFNIIADPSDPSNVAAKLVIKAGETLVFDTSNKATNLHCIFEGGIKLEENAKIVLKGGNMTFIYLGKEAATVDETVNPDSNVLLELGANVKIGEVTSGQEEVLKRDSIYFITNSVSLVKFGQNASLYGYLYAPNSFLRIYENLTEPSKENPAIKEGSTNTVLRGSMLIRGFKIDMTLPYETVYRMYKNLKFEYVTAPLILDKNIQYGDNQQQVDDFGKINWGFIGYD